MKSNATVNIGVAILVVLILFALLVSSSGPKRAGKIVMSKLEMSDLNMAITQYHNEYGICPTGNQVEIIRCLLGDNPKKIQFVSLNTSRLDINGNFLDPWLTPYQIELSQQTNLLIRSAGPNRKFGDADDIIFNSVSNNFVKP